VHRDLDRFRFRDDHDASCAGSRGSRRRVPPSRFYPLRCQISARRLADMAPAAPYWLPQVRAGGSRHLPPLLPLLLCIALEAHCEACGEEPMRLDYRCLSCFIHGALCYRNNYNMIAVFIGMHTQKRYCIIRRSIWHNDTKTMVLTLHSAAISVVVSD
jgi:hypothetical protein